MVTGNRPDHRRNVLAAIGHQLLEPAGRCLMTATVLRKALPGKHLGPPVRHRVVRLSGEFGSISVDCLQVLESRLRNLLSYTQLERVQCSFR